MNADNQQYFGFYFSGEGDIAASIEPAGGTGYALRDITVHLGSALISAAELTVTLSAAHGGEGVSHASTWDAVVHREAVSTGATDKRIAFDQEIIIGRGDTLDIAMSNNAGESWGIIVGGWQT